MKTQPKIILEYTDPKSYKTEQIVEAESIFFITLNGQPINLRQLNKLVDYPGPKYKKVVFFGKKNPAFSLAEKLNKTFKTTNFAVAKMSLWSEETRDS